MEGQQGAQAGAGGTGQPGAGLFDGLAGGEAADPKAGAPAQGGEGGGEPQGGAAGEGGKAGEGDGGGQPAKLYAGRFKTPEELETEFLTIGKRYEESGREAMRLYHETRAFGQERQKFEAQIADLQRELKEARETPAFRELSSEELTHLFDTDKAKAIDYLTEKKLREKDLATKRAEAKRQEEETRRSQAETAAYVNSRIDAMMNDSGKFPDFQALMPAIDDIVARTGGEDSPLTGHKWTPEVLYLAAFGYRALQAHRKSAAASSEADRKAKAQAAAAAAAGGSAGGGPGGGPPKPGGGPESDADFNKRLLALRV